VVVVVVAVVVEDEEVVSVEAAVVEVVEEEAEVGVEEGDSTKVLVSSSLSDSSVFGWSVITSENLYLFKINK
jgi:hypothetical protein